jgi:Family of unknown function (DUF6177)
MTTHPSIDIVTDQAAVVIQQRRVVPFTSWLADALMVCGQSDRELQILTPEEARLTTPARLVLAGSRARWVVRHDDGHYDGLTGATLHWNGEAFTPATDPDGNAPVAGPFRTPPSDPLGPQLSLTFRTRQPAAGGTLLGGAVETLCEALAGSGPRGWGTSEPATRTWRRDELTELCRDRSPQSTWLVYVGGGQRPAIGMTLITRTESGIEETTALVIGYGTDEEPPFAALPEAVAELTGGHELIQLFAQIGAGPHDLTSPPRWTGYLTPVGLAVGPESIRDVGPDRAQNPPGVTAHSIGSARNPAYWYPLTDGQPKDAWSRFERLMRHLTPRSPA